MIMKCKECPDYAKCVKEENLAIKRKNCPKAKTERKKTNADRIRAMSDEELAVFLADEVPHGDCYDCRLGCIWSDKGEFESVCQKAWHEWLMLPAEREGEDGEE